MRRLLAAALGAALWVGAVAAETLTADQMRAYGSAALVQGFADDALGVAEALLQRDKRDSLAWTLKAQALRLRGDLEASEAAARQAWATASDPAARYSAATALAQALSLQDQRTQAQYWLRQATQNAPTPGARAQSVADFNYVREQNPLRIAVETSFRPSNNVNGGTRETSFYVPIFGGLDLPYLPGDRALSGDVWSMGLSGSYKLRDTGARQDALTFSLTRQGAALSPRAHAAAPYLRDGMFTYEQISAGFETKLALPDGLVTLDLTAGRSWYGGSKLADSLTAQAQLDRNVSAKITGSFSARLSRQVRDDRPQSSSTEAGATAAFGTTGKAGDHWQLGFDLSETFSRDAGVANSSATLSLDWQAAKPIAGLGLGASAAIRGVDYLSGRHDTKVSLGLTGSVKSLSYLGFSPILSLDLARNTSDNSRFSTDAMGIGFSIKSNF